MTLRVRIPSLALGGLLLLSSGCRILLEHDQPPPPDDGIDVGVDHEKPDAAAISETPDAGFDDTFDGGSDDPFDGGSDDTFDGGSDDPFDGGSDEPFDAGTQPMRCEQEGQLYDVGASVPALHRCELCRCDADGVIRCDSTSQSIASTVPTQALDVLFVVDTSGSMGANQAAMQAKARSVLSLVQATQSDFRIAFTTMDLSSRGENGRFVPLAGSVAQPRILTAATPDLETVFGNRIAGLGTMGAVEEMGLEAARQALSAPLIHQVDDPRFAQPNDGNAGFLRDEAALAVVFVSDEEDDSIATTTAYAQFLQSLKSQSIHYGVTAHGIVSTASAPCGGLPSSRYLDVVQKLGGFVLPLCSAAPPSWGSTPTGETARSIFHVEPQMTLTAPAVDLDGDGLITEAAGEIEVAVNHQVLPSTSGTTTNWTYDPQTKTVVFTRAANLQPEMPVEVVWGCVP